MCSTTPKTKAANPGVTEPAKITKPTNGSGGGGGGGSSGGGSAGGPGVIAKFGTEQEHVPDLTFIVAPRVSTDDYIAGAMAYHSNCGLNPQQINSIDHLVNLLSADTSVIKRIRIVGHASGKDLLIPIFGQSSERSERHAPQKHLADFAISDEAGLLGLFDMAPAQHHVPWVMTEIIDMTRTANNTLLDPFGMKTSGIPTTQEDLKHFIFYCCDYAHVNLGFYKKKTKDLTPDEKNGMLKAYDQIIAIRAKKIEGTKFGTHTVTSAELNALSSYLKQRSDKDLTLTKEEIRRFNDVAGSLNPLLLAAHAADAVAGGFRGRLEKVRKRFNSNSFIDIRGCRAGNEIDYLRAIQDFFGEPSSTPKVTAPTWYQAFAPVNKYHHPEDRAAVHTLLTSGTAATDIRKGFAVWAIMSHVEPEHKQVWLDALDDSAAKFVLLEWRKKLPQLPVPTPGLTSYLSMNLVDFINKTRDFFNVPSANMPSTSALGAINTFVTGKLAGYAQHLFAQLDSNTDKTRRDNILAALNTINVELGKPVDPAPTGSLAYLDLKDYQEKLVTNINDKKIVDIKPLMKAVKDRINDSADPGLNYYMLFSGMPVFAFADHESINDHVITVMNNRLVILNAYAEPAFRAWAQLSWAEPLPAGNKFASMQPSALESRRVMSVVEKPTGGNTDAAVCPHENYFKHITSV